MSSRSLLCRLCGSRPSSVTTPTSPLTRAQRAEPGLTEKWDLYVRSFELGTGYSELVDPLIQRERFEEQAKLAQKGDAEAMPLDEDFLRAMEYGMPPGGGVGIGIDRLLMGVDRPRLSRNDFVPDD